MVDGLRLSTLASIALCLGLVAGVSAAEEQLPKQRLYAFSISSRPLSPALLAFSRTTGISLLVAKSEISNQQAPAVEGALTPTEALTKLLLGSGLGFKYVDRETVSIT